jgi:outer membrane protein assembly factor BamE (lipoprotein component of BamABCDE complex)
MLLPAVSKGLVNGLTEAQALDVLGEPDARRNNDWYYLVNQKQGGHKFISLTFENGTVTGIHETTKAAEQVQQK